MTWSNKRRARKIAVRAALAAAALGLSVALAELVTRWLGAAPAVHRIRTNLAENAYQTSDNPHLAYTLKANYRNDSPNFRDTFRATNSHGQRDVERTLARRHGVRRILLLGDSIVAGHGIRHVDHTISRQLERKLGGQEVIEVLNFGVGGYCTRSEVELLRTRGLRFKPDAVILVFFMDDALPFNRQIGRVGLHRPAWTEEAFIRSHLFRLVAMELDLFLFRTQTAPALMEQWQSDRIGEQGLQEAVGLLQGLAAKHRFKLIVVTWPHFTEDHIDGLDNIPVMTTLRRLLRKGNIPSTGIALQFQDHYISYQRRGGTLSPNKYYTIGDRNHPNRKGAEVAAEILAGVVRRRLWSSPR